MERLEEVPGVEEGVLPRNDARVINGDEIVERFARNELKAKRGYGSDLQKERM